MQVLTSPTDAGWYAIAFADDEGCIDWSNATLAEYIGGGEWVDEDGEPMTSLYDPSLGHRVSVNGADGYVRQ